MAQHEEHILHMSLKPDHSEHSKVAYGISLPATTVGTAQRHILASADYNGVHKGICLDALNATTN
jgi:hypothetical protein